MKHTILLLLLFISGAAFSQEDKYPETVLIKIFESAGNSEMLAEEARMIIITPDDTKEIRQLEQVKLLHPDYLPKLIENQLIIRTELQKWHNKGFKVMTSNSVWLSSYIITTYVLQKN